MNRIRALLRVLTLALVLLAICVGTTLRRAEARLTETLREFGEGIARIDGFRPHSVPRQLFLNGLAFGVISVSTPLDVGDALQRVQSTCRHVGEIDMPAAVRQKLVDDEVNAGAADIRGAGAARPKGRAGRVALSSPEKQDRGSEPEPSVQHASSAPPLGVMRAVGADQGWLACLDVGSGQTMETFLERLEQLGKTGDLGALGQLRYAMAKRSGGVTTLLLIWTEGSAKLAEMFPATGDAPGRDPVDVPRLASSRRILSAYEQGFPNGFSAYEVERQSIDLAAKEFQSRLTEGGWQIRRTRPGAIIAEKSGRRVVVQLRERLSGHVVVTISDLG